MAGPRIQRNLPPAGKDELAGEAPSKGNSTPTPTLASASASTPGPPSKYTDEDLQKATKLALESFV